MATSNSYSEPWRDIANGWAKLGVGNHPSRHDVKVYERLMLEALHNAKHARVLLLGATPELRDMLSRHGEIKVTVLEINPEMYKAMSLLMHRSSVNEEYVSGNWLDALLPKHSYHVILGDQVKSNVSWKDQDTLWRHLHLLLKPDGRLITRLTTRLPASRLYDPERLIKHYASIKPNKRSRTYFWNRLCFFTHANPISTTDRMYALLERHLSEPFIRAYYDELLTIMPRGKSWCLGRPWDEERAVIERYFEIIHKEQDDTCFKDSTFIYLMKPRAKTG